MGFTIGLVFGVLAGISAMSLCISVKSRNVFTNADRLALDTEQLADLIYRADDVSPEICKAEFDNADGIQNCKHLNDNRGCRKCIQEWLNKEVDFKCKD